METQTSHFDYLFLLNVPIPIHTVRGQSLNVKTPSLYEYYTKEQARSLEHIFLMSLEQVKSDPLTYGFEADTYIDLILGMKMVDSKDEIFEYFEQITGTIITAHDITRNGVPLVEEDVIEIKNAYLIALGKYHIDGTPKKGLEEEDELTRKMRETQEKIDSLRKKQPEAKGEEISMKQMIMIIIYELNKTVEELRDMNFYGLYELHKIAEQASYDKIEKIAAGNGNFPQGKSYKNILSK